MAQPRSSDLRIAKEPRIFSDIEPIYVAQTHDVDVSDGLACREWFRKRAKDAAAEGATFFRYSFDKEPPGLLIEGWTEQPEDQKDPRWSFAAKPT